MSALNKWIDATIKLVNSNGYLDKLLSVYPITMNKERELPEGAEDRIKELLKGENNVELINYLLTLEKFPIATAYTSSLRYPGMINKNPETVNRIAGILRNMGAEMVIKGAKEPKIVSKQAGAMFLKWLTKQYPAVPLSDFESITDRPVLLVGSDKKRKQYANDNLNAELTEKGIDILLKKGNKFVIGQAKFITAGGGGQDNQFFEALRFVNSIGGDAERVAILDGVIWFDNKFLERIKASNKNIMSSLMLKAFVDDL
ncbi:MAG: hypothetical protein QXS81_04180 [Candidatus Micrarchaeaceae archaeon]